MHISKRKYKLLLLGCSPSMKPYCCGYNNNVKHIMLLAGSVTSYADICI